MSTDNLEMDVKLANMLGTSRAFVRFLAMRMIIEICIGKQISRVKQRNIYNKFYQKEKRGTLDNMR